jgi:hypothetical protein
LTKENVKQIMHFIITQKTITETICSGGLANETLFAVIFKLYKELDDNSTNKHRSHILSVSSHIADWNRRSSTTSPHVFKDANETDIKFIDDQLERNHYSCFIRKISPDFPDDILKYYIYENNKEIDEKIVLKEPIEMLINRYYFIVKKYGFYLILLFGFYYLLYYYLKN